MNIIHGYHADSMFGQRRGRWTDIDSVCVNWCSSVNVWAMVMLIGVLMIMIYKS